MQRHILNLHRGLLGNFATRVGAILAMTGLLLVLSACDSRGNTVAENNLSEPAGMDGVAPTLVSVSIRESSKTARPGGTASLGKSVLVEILASESIMTPAVTINGVAAQVTGKADEWQAVREMTEADADGDVTFLISFQDISGEVGLIVTSSTDGSAVQYCAEGCPETGPVTLAGDWRLDGDGAAGVGPTAGDVSWWASTDANGAGPEVRACLFDDIYRFGEDGSFRNIQGDETWLETWQGVEADGCGTPIAPHDGSSAGTWTYDEAAGELTITGTGSYLGLAKAVNGQELPSPGDAPASIVYDVLTFDGDSLIVTVDSGIGWWTFRLARDPVSPVVGKWKLDGDGAAGVGPTSGDVSWWASTDANGAGPEVRACWFDDIYEFSADGSFRNVQGGETWLETWQGVEADGCGAPVAPHDGTNPATYSYDDAAGTLVLDGLGAYLGLAKAVNGQELASPGDAPESVTYDVLTLDGDNMTVTVDSGVGWWTFRLVRVSNSPLIGNWKLDGDGAAGVGPTSGDVSWWASTDANGAGPEVRACWFDDVYVFGDDASFRNVQGGETWLETWQGVEADGCGAPIAPHDGTNPATYSYDAAAGLLVLDGVGAHLGLAKAVNGQELPSPGAAPDSVAYDVLTLDGDNMTVTVDSGTGWWTFRLVRVSNSPVIGKWKLAGDGAAGVGPTSGDVSWWASTDANGAGPEVRACWFDDIYHFGSDGTFQNYHGAETWLETWQGVEADGCGAPVAPHVNDNTGTYSYDGDAGTLMLNGVGSYLGLAKAVNGQELGSPGDTPASVTYDVLTLDGNNMTVTVDSGTGWWTFALQRVTDTAALAGEWKLNGDGAAGVGPTSGDVSWWASTDANGAGPEVRACWFDDVFSFGADGSFMNDQGGETWLETWQGVANDGCDAPIAPHDGSARAIFEYDDAAGKLTIYGRGAHLGLAKAVNGQELSSPGDTPEFVTYDVLTLDGDIMKVTVDSGIGWWTFDLTK